MNGPSMTGPDDHEAVMDNLPGLLLGDLDRATLDAVVTHLESCAVCRDDLVDVAGAHAAVLAAHRTLSGRDRPAHTGTAGTPEGETAAGDALPPLPALPSPGRRRRRVTALVSGLAAACLALGVGIGVVVARPESTPAPQAQVQSAALNPVEGDGSGKVTMKTPVSSDKASALGTTMTIRTTGLPAAPSGTFYYAWLFDPSTNKMLGLGVVGPDGTATFNVDPTLVSQFHAIDVSLQANNGDPAHSARSVLRGEY